MTIDEIVENGADLINESYEKFLAYASDNIETFNDYTEIVDILNNLFNLDLDYTVYYTGNRETFFYETFDGLKEVTVLSDVIYKNAFRQIETLETVNLTKPIKFIGRRAFSYCFKLTNIDFSKIIGEIDNSAFRHAKLSGTISPNCTKIGIHSFEDTHMDTVILDNVVDMGAACFKESSVKTVRIGRNIDGGNTLFDGCNSLREIQVPIKLQNTLKFPSSVQAMFGDIPSSTKIQYY